jgi:hypothetical protein
MKEIQTTITTSIQIPTVPNLIKIGNHFQPVHFFSEEQLKEIAAEWAKELLAKRKAQLRHT